MPSTPLKPKPKRKVNIPFRKIWTPNVLTVLLAHFLLAARKAPHPSFPPRFPCSPSVYRTKVHNKDENS